MRDEGPGLRESRSNQRPRGNEEKPSSDVTGGREKTSVQGGVCTCVDVFRFMDEALGSLNAPQKDRISAGAR